MMPLYEVEEHPLDDYLRTERLPHVWCAGCGIGTVLSCYLYALKELGIPPKNAVMVSGIGCSGRAAGYVNMDSFHTTHGRAIPFATGLKLANRKLNVTVMSGDGDLFAIGGNHLIHAARRNIDINVICINNFIYGMTGGQLAPTTPQSAITSTSPYGNIEPPFNLVGLAAVSGATYVARWTSMHPRRLKNAFVEALDHHGFSFVEILSPCPIAYGRRNKMREAIDMLHYFEEKGKIEMGANPLEADITPGKKIILGKFIHIEGELALDDKLYGMMGKEFLEKSDIERKDWIIERRRHLGLQHRLLTEGKLEMIRREKLKKAEVIEIDELEREEEEG